MSFFVVDTNVPIVANDKHPNASPDCVIACVDALEEVRENGILLLDDLGLIFGEYKKKLNMSGQPGLGDAFIKWIHDVQGDETHCKQVHITPSAVDPLNFDEFPADERLKNFDRSDRKFVAVALASGEESQILNAVDSDWANHFAALSENGLHIEFLCPQHVTPGR